jgi:hypothetical protein
MCLYLQLQALHQHQLISLQERDLEVWEAKLAEEQACGLHSFDGSDLLAKLEELCVHLAGVEDEHAIEAGELLTLVIEASNTVVDLRMLPMWDIPQLLMIAQEVMALVLVPGIVRGPAVVPVASSHPACHFFSFGSKNTSPSYLCPYIPTFLGP